MKLKEVILAIEAAKMKSDLLNELTPENKAFLSRRDGTFEAVLIGKGDEKCLIPEVGVLHFLYRGQNKESIPCLPTLYRGEPNEVQIFLQRMRLVMFERLLKSHPVVTHFFQKHHFVIDAEGLAQHYGLKTEVLDLTSSLDVALFFATCKYDRETDSYDYCHEEGEYEGILYVFDPIFDNEPTPVYPLTKYMNGNITPIGLQAFPRPGAQFGYALHIGYGGSTKSWMYKFTFTSKDSKHYYDLFHNGESLWLKDRLIVKTKQIGNMSTFSYNVFQEAYDRYRPKGYSKTKLKASLSFLEENIRLVKKQPDIVFSDDERREIIEEWNTKLGKTTCEKIVRKYWYEYDGIEEQNDGKEGKIIGIKNRKEYNTMEHIADFMLLKLIATPEGPEGAVWKNYTNTPSPKVKFKDTNATWKKIPASMNTVFGTPYLTEEDWKIEL